MSNGIAQKPKAQKAVGNRGRLVRCCAVRNCTLHPGGTHSAKILAHGGLATLRVKCGGKPARTVVKAELKKLRKRNPGGIVRVKETAKMSQKSKFNSDL